MTTRTKESLADRLRSGPLSVQDSVQICRLLLSAIETAHERGIAHGPISVGTVVLEDGRPVFGGSPIDAGIDAADTPAADVYAVAMVLYESLSGRAWSPGMAPRAADWSGVPRRLRRVLQKALAQQPEKRWPHVSAFQRALWVPRPQDPIWPAVAVLLLAAAIIGAVVLCEPLGFCRQRVPATETR